MAVLILADHDNSELNEATLHAITVATVIDAEIHVLVAGENCGSVAEAAAKVSGVAKAIHVDDAAYAHQLAENMAQLVVGLAPDYSHVIAAHNAHGKNIMPRAAAMLDVAQISDIVAIEGPDTFVRPIYAGNAMATVKSSDAIKFVTVRATAFAAAEETSGSGVVETAPGDLGGVADAGLSVFDSQDLSSSERPELTSARIVISGGRGMQSGENFHLLEEIADILGAAVGASRAAVDAGYVTNEYQVGQTGKIVAPDLYIAVGISGAIQHLAGMKDSKVIVAINKDEEAPIFQVADYGVAGDLFTVLPDLKAALGS